jgi:hypothetical protein
LVDLVVVVAVVSVGRCGGDACECGETEVTTSGEHIGKPNLHFHNFCLRLLGLDVAVAVPVVSVALVATAARDNNCETQQKEPNVIKRGRINEREEEKRNAPGQCRK